MSPASPRPRKISFLTGALVALTAGTLLAGCAQGGSGSSASSSSSTSKVPTSLTVGLSQNPVSLDPGQTGLVGSNKVDSQIFDPLIWRFAGSKSYEPGLALSYTVNADATEFTFKLRHDVKFQDGTPFNAAAVKATFDHIVDPATKSLSAASSMGPYKETDVIDDYTAKVVFSSPYPAFNTLVASTGLAIDSPTALQKYGADYSNHPVGTGPFSFVSFTNGSEVKLKQNPDYNWGPKQFGTGPAKIKNLTFRVLTDPTAQNNALSTGEIQVADGLDTQDVASAKTAGKSIASVDPAGMPYGYLLNVTKSPTDDIKVRQAISHAVDRKAIITTLFQGQYDLATGVTTKATPGYAAAGDALSYDPKLAGQLLDQAGWKMVNGQRTKDGQPLTIDMVNISNFGFDDMSTIVQSQLKKVGITAKLSDQAFPTVGTTYNTGKDSNTASWFFFSLDPNMIKSVFTCAQIASGFNWSHYCTPDLDKQIAAADATSDPTARDAAFKKVFTELNNQSVFLPIYDLKTILVSNGIKGIIFTPDGLPYYAGLGK
jgi:peptide/nickel transport system substrate-binding protein